MVGEGFRWLFAVWLLVVMVDCELGAALVADLLCRLPRERVWLALQAPVAELTDCSGEVEASGVSSRLGGTRQSGGVGCCGWLGAAGVSSPPGRYSTSWLCGAVLVAVLFAVLLVVWKWVGCW